MLGRAAEVDCCRRRRFASAVPSMLCCGMVAGAAVQDVAGAPPAMFSSQELQARLRESQDAIRSFRVEYQSARAESGTDPSGRYLHRVVAARAPGYVFHLSAHGHDRLDWADDPFQQRAYVTPAHLYNVFPANRAFFEAELKASDPLPGSLAQEFFFITTGVWPLVERAPPRLAGRPVVLREVAASPDYTVRAEQAEVEGRFCHVLVHEGVDSLWIDQEHGFALAAREMQDPQTGAVMQRFELSGHREAAPGIWLPGTIRNLQFDYAAPRAEDRGRALIDSTMTVLSATANDVDESVFRFEPPPGAVRLSAGEDNVPRQVTPGGAEHLDALASWLAENELPGDLSGNGGREWLGYLAGLPFLLAIAACEGLRRRRLRAIRGKTGDRS